MGLSAAGNQDLKLNNSNRIQNPVFPLDRPFIFESISFPGKIITLTCRVCIYQNEFMLKILQPRAKDQVGDLKFQKNP